MGRVECSQDHLSEPGRLASTDNPTLVDPPKVVEGVACQIMKTVEDDGVNTAHVCGDCSWAKSRLRS